MKLVHARGHDIDTLVAHCREGLGPGHWPLALLFVSDALAPHLPLLLAELKLATGIPHWAGSVGMAVHATGAEYYDEPALALLALDMDDDSFRILPSIKAHPETPLAPILPWLQEQAHCFGLIHADPGNPLTPDLIGNLPRFLPDPLVIGGVTSSRTEPWQIADEPVHGGLSGVLFGEGVCAMASHSQGCMPISQVHEITRAERNLVIELDGRPALEVFREDIGDLLARDLSRVAGFIFAALPVEEPGAGTGRDYLVRNIVGIDEHQQLLAIGDLVQPGQRLMFARRDANTAREDLLAMVDELLERLPGPPRAGVYYACLGRGREMFGTAGAEMALLRERLGDLPIAGFQANGEIHNGRLYGFTGVLGLFC
ncbi:MAG: histidine kinase [Gammaproteobacteria bacterium]|nr:MAG: histidine kinase [Gammaproteobacteria bacterium]